LGEAGFAVTVGASWTEAEVEEILRRHAGRMGALLPILNDVQAAFGFVPDAAVPVVAEALNLSRAEVHGVVTFYHDLKRRPAERPVIKLCRAEACQARGVDRIAPLFEGDARIEVETVYCLGLCASGPAAMIGERVFARLNDASSRRLIDEAAA
jgi:formate dehydrogenase subunit gamma